MKPRLRHIPLLLLSAIAAALPAEGLRALPRPRDKAATEESDLLADTVIQVDRVQVTAIKQGLMLRSEPVASSILGERMLERRHVDALKDASLIVPNLHIPDYGSRMTSSIYVRGLGARIDQPVMGLNVDNVPVLNKDNYDTELADIERIEVLRGPQSTLYGRNTMGGVINVYTLSPLTYEGIRLGMEYGSGNTLKLRAAAYQKLREGLGLSVTGYYSHSDGLFENRSTGKLCDWERNAGGRWRLQWRSGSRWQIDNTFAVSVLRQGGYPYAYVGEEIKVDGQSVIRPGEISYNDPSSYRRTLLSDGLTVRYEGERFTLASITSYQYSDDEMILDQDFLPLSYFTLRQARTEHTLTEDIVIRKRGKGNYRWLFGAFGFYRHGVMDAPVRFKQYGIDELILKHINQVNPDYVDVWDDDNFVLGSTFRMPTLGAALYHESEYRTGRWRFTAGLRFDYEHATLRYRNFTDTGCKTYRTDEEGNRELVATTPIKIDTRGTLRDLFTELLPKVTVTYSFDENRNLYLSVAKGYKAGGFNTQMFSDVLQQQIMKEFFHVGTQYDIRKVVGYDPEYSWNYEVGGHFSCLEGAIRGDFALFWIDCRDQHGAHDDQCRPHAQPRRRGGPAGSAPPQRGAQRRLWIHRRPLRGVQQRHRGLRREAHPLRPGAHLLGPRLVGDSRRPALARAHRPAGRPARHGTDCLERAELAPAVVLPADGSLGALRAAPLLARPLGPQPRRYALRRLLLPLHRQRLRAAGTSAHLRHNAQHQPLAKD